MSLTSVLSAAGLLVTVAGAIVPVRAQGVECTNGRDCCVVAASNGPPRRYIVSCDGAAQNAFTAAAMSGYTVLVLGPASWARCSAWMGNAGIPGWSRNPAYNFPAPQPDTSCMPGRNCCYIGSNGRIPAAYARGYDGAVFTGSSALAQGGYPFIVYGPVSFEACQTYWNQSGFGGSIGTPSGAVPVPAGYGPYPSPPPITIPPPPPISFPPSPPPFNNTIPPLPPLSSGGTAGASQGPAGPAVDCVGKYCPMCGNAISLMGVSASADCTNCKSRYATQISQCYAQNSSRGSSPASTPTTSIPGYNTSGLPGPIVYCVYQIFQPSLNNYRHEIGKCAEIHSSTYWYLYGPATFMGCRDWIQKKGFAQ